MEKVRTFIAINLPDEVIAELEKVQHALRAQLAPDAVRWSQPPQMHLTLKFLGDIEVEKIGEVEAALRRACRNSAPFSLAVQHLGCFPNPRSPRVIWVGIGGDVGRLHKLQASIEREVAGIGEPAEARPFHPHLTLGRVKTTDRRVLRTIGQSIETTEVATLGPWAVQQVHLMRSQLSPKGAIYTSLAAIELAADL
ncbi:MAG: RNA 2',3'-cyclic phosphodiesterase [Armatimonadota bacterium]|nr:RNA 2',3'-cyclic phosphodiesterase [Armatimonadota bacterium]